MIRAKDGNGCCTSWCCCIRQQIAELWQRIEGTVRGVKMNGTIIEPDGDGIVDLDVNFPVDGAMDPTSTNPVQNRVVTDAILTERNERIEDDRRHDLQIQGLETEMQTKLTTPSGGVQGQVLGKGAQGIGWVDTITEQRAQQMEEDIASVDGRLTREISDREAADTALGQSIAGKQDALVSGTNIKTINGESILGNGDIVIQAGMRITPYSGMMLRVMFANGWFENAKFISGKLFLQSGDFTQIIINGSPTKSGDTFYILDGEWCNRGNNYYRNISRVTVNATPSVEYFASDSATSPTSLQITDIRFRGIVIYDQ